MELLRTFADGVGHLTGGARRSVARARLEAEHRSLQRRHAQALQDLGARVRDLAGRGVVADTPFSAELAAVREHEVLLAAKSAEIAAIGLADIPDGA